MPSPATPTSARFRVQWNDTDASGRIHYSRVFWWVEAVEAEWFSASGLDPWVAIDYPRRRVEAEYLAPLRFADVVDVRLQVERLGTSSIWFAWEVVRGATPAIRGRHTIVRVGSDGRPVAIHDEIRAFAI